MSKKSRERRAAYLKRKGIQIHSDQQYHRHSRAAEHSPKKLKVNYFQDSGQLRLAVKRLKEANAVLLKENDELKSNIQFLLRRE